MDILNLLNSPFINIQVLGLLIDIIGAYYIVRSFIVKKPADIKNEVYGNANQNLQIPYGMSGNLFFSFYLQGIEARIGLVLVVTGFVLQSLGVLFELFISFFILVLVLVIAAVGSVFAYRFFADPRRLKTIHDRDETKFDTRLKKERK